MKANLFALALFLDMSSREFSHCQHHLFFCELYTHFINIEAMSKL